MHTDTIIHTSMDTHTHTTMRMGILMKQNNVVTEQLTEAGRAIEHDSFAVIDREVLSHGYTAEQWPIVRRMIHASGDLDLVSLVRFHNNPASAALNALARKMPIITDTMIMTDAAIYRYAASMSLPALFSIRR